MLSSNFLDAVNKLREAHLCDLQVLQDELARYKRKVIKLNDVLQQRETELHELKEFHMDVLDKCSVCAGKWNTSFNSSLTRASSSSSSVPLVQLDDDIDYRIKTDSPVSSTESPNRRQSAGKQGSPTRSTTPADSKRRKLFDIDVDEEDQNDGGDRDDNNYNKHSPQIQGTGTIEIPDSDDINVNEAFTASAHRHHSSHRQPKSQPQPRGGGLATPYKYSEPVRKKAERDKLPGHDCEHCAKFYEAVSDGADPKIRQGLINACSRHKHIHTPPGTPPGYWDMSFPGSPDSSFTYKKHRPTTDQHSHRNTNNAHHGSPRVSEDVEEVEIKHHGGARSTEIVKDPIQEILDASIEVVEV